MVFEHPVRVYWEDTDAGGIVFYANYLKFFERARTEWLRSLGIGQHGLREQSGGMFVVSEARLRYHAPARLDDALIVTAELMEKGRASLTIKAFSLGVEMLNIRLRRNAARPVSLRPARIPTVLLETIS